MHSSHHFLNHFLLHKKINEMYVAIFLMNIAESLITVFIPIYLFLFNYSVAWIIGFFTLGSLGSVVLAMPAAWVVSKLGPKRSLLLSTPFLIVYYVGLRFLPNPMVVLGIACAGRKSCHAL